MGLIGFFFFCLESIWICHSPEIILAINYFLQKHKPHFGVDHFKDIVTKWTHGKFEKEKWRIWGVIIREKIRVKAWREEVVVAPKMIQGFQMLKVLGDFLNLKNRSY